MEGHILSRSTRAYIYHSHGGHNYRDHSSLISFTWRSYLSRSRGPISFTWKVIFIEITQTYIIHMEGHILAKSLGPISFTWRSYRDYSGLYYSHGGHIYRDHSSLHCISFTWRSYLSKSLGPIFIHMEVIFIEITRAYIIHMEAIFIEITQAYIIHMKVTFSEITRAYIIHDGGPIYRNHIGPISFTWRSYRDHSGLYIIHMRSRLLRSRGPISFTWRSCYSNHSGLIIPWWQQWSDWSLLLHVSRIMYEIINYTYEQNMSYVWEETKAYIQLRYNIRKRI